MSAPQPSFAEPAFDLSGGAACLDLVNTVGDRGRAAVERLDSYEALLAFAVQAGLIEPERATRLAARATAEPRRASRVVDEARALREAVYEVFATAAAGGEPPRSALDELDRQVPEALSHLRLEPATDGWSLAWADADDDLTAPLRRLTRSAVELLTGPSAERVRQCDSPTCSWLFLDSSRNRSRRWCDMASCGNRAKARRHYRRQRAGVGGA